MRLDLDAIAKAVDAAKEQARIEFEAMKLRSPLTEARLLAAMIADPGVLEQCDDVELEDFTDYRYRAIFASIRSLQASGAAVDLLSIADDIAMDDIAYGKCIGQTVDVVFLGCMLADEPKYYGETILLDRDRTWLRTLQRRRAAL